MKTAAGGVLWLGAALVSMEFDIKNFSAAAMQPGWAVRLAVANDVTKLPRWDFTATDVPPDSVIGGLFTSGGAAFADVAFLGVTLEVIGINAVGRICGPGSITCVQTVSPLASAVRGNAVGSAATDAASCDTSATVTPGRGQVLGMCIMLSGTATQQTGSVFQTGIMVAPG